MDSLWQSQSSLGAHFPKPSGLETQLDPSRFHQKRFFWWNVIAGQIASHLADDSLTVPPGLLNHLIGGTVEINAKNVGRFDGRCDRHAWSLRSLRKLWLLGHARAGCEMSGHLGLSLIWQRPAAEQLTVRNHIVARRMKHRLNGQRARLASIELERRKKVYVFDRRNMPAREHAGSRLRKRLDTHDSG